MRISERLMYSLGAALCIFQAFMFHSDLLSDHKAEIGNDAIICLLLVTALIGGFYEGIRYQQYLFLLAFTIQSVLIIFEIHSTIALSLYTIVLILSILNSCIFGEATFNSLKMTGTY